MRMLVALLTILTVHLSTASADQLLVSELNSLVRRANAQVLPMLRNPGTTNQEKLALWNEFRKTIDGFASKIPTEESLEAIAAANRIAYLYEFIDITAPLLKGRRAHEL